MTERVEIEGRPLQVRLSPAARAALADRQRPLLADVKLLFSCFIAKRVSFQELDGETDTVPVSDNLRVRFNAIMTQTCAGGSGEAEFSIDEFSVAEPRRYVPHWLHIDYAGGEWRGEFGYAEEPA